MSGDQPAVAEPAASPSAWAPAAVAAVGLAATAGFAIAPAGSLLKGVLWAVPFVLAAALLVRRTASAPAQQRAPLRMLLAGVLVYLLTLFPWYVGPVHAGWVLPFPSLVDLGFFTAYALYAAFLFVLLRAGAADSRLESRLAAIDAVIVSLALSAVLWVTVVEEQLAMHLPARTTATVLLYPAFQLVLLALAVRLSAGLGGGRGRGPLVLVLVWIGAELLADVLYGVQSVDGTFRYDGPLMLAWMTAYAALATFAAHPAAAAVLQSTPEPERAGEAPADRLQRLVGTGARLAAASVPVGLALLHEDHDGPLLLVAIGTFALVFFRMALLSGGLVEQRRLAAELEDALRQLNTQHEELSRLAAAVEASEEAVVTCSPSGALAGWNRGAESLYGFRREEAVGRTVEDLFPPEEAQAIGELLAEASETGHLRFEFLITRRNGSAVEVEGTMSSICEDDGQLLGFVVISRAVTERNVLHRELAEQARRLAEAQQVAQVGSWEWELATDVVVWSAELYRIFGLDPATPMTPAVYLQHVHPADRDWVAQEIARLDRSMDFEGRIVRADGEVRWVAVRGGVLVDADGVPVRKAGTAQDVTERVVLQRELAAQVRRLDEAQRLAGVGSFDVDVVTGSAVWSPELYRILGVEEGTPASPALYLDRLHPEDRELVQPLLAGPEGEGSFDYETRIVRPDGQVRWLGVRGEVERDGEGRPARRRGAAADITERRLVEGELQRLARTDTLTGLANRDGFTALLKAALADLDGERVVGLMLLDLDGFKDVNDGLGHHAGDLVLQEVARRARATLRGGDEVARLGGDEFAVVLPGIGTPDRAVEVAASLRACLEEPFDLEGVTVHVGGSIGIAVTDRPIDPSALLKQADVAMYRAKKLSSGWAVFEAGQDDVAAGRLQLVTDLRRAIECGQLGVAYQPIIATRSRQVSSFEALARWNHPERGSVPPDQFIPLAEQADLIVPLTRLVLSKAASACAAWRRAGHDLRVGVNLSVQVMENADTRALVAEALAEGGLEAQHLILEITESSLAHDAETINGILHGLRDLGVTLVIDDFGTGYSAMSYLKQLPVEELKVDRSFVRDIATDGRDLVIVRSLVRLAHSLGLRVVAEGVESLPVLDVLAGLGCDFAQGYGIARPMAEQQIAGWLARYDAGGVRGPDRAVPRHLLVVDDSAVVRTSLSARAEQEGWLVRTAASAEEALVEVERAVPDVVILDHHMTGMTGMEAVPELRIRGVDGPILLFTQFLSDAMPGLRVPLDVWPVSKSNADAVFGLLDGYRSSIGEEEQPDQT